MGIAAFLIGLSVLLLVGYNWDAMSSTLKLGDNFHRACRFAHRGVSTCDSKHNALMLSEVVYFLASFFSGRNFFNRPDFPSQRSST